MQAETAAGVIHAMDRMASSLEKKGLLKEAEELDAATNAVQQSATDPGRASFTYHTLQQYPDLLRATPEDIQSLMKVLSSAGAHPDLWWPDSAHVSFEGTTLGAPVIKALASVGSLVEVTSESDSRMGEYSHSGYSAEINVKRTPEFNAAATAALQDILKKKEYKGFDPSI